MHAGVHKCTWKAFFQMVPSFPLHVQNVLSVDANGEVHTHMESGKEEITAKCHSVQRSGALCSARSLLPFIQNNFDFPIHVFLPKFSVLKYQLN